MGDLVWGVVAVLLVGWGVLAYEWWGLPRRSHRVIVNFVASEAASIEGLLWARRGRWLVLRDCVLLDPTRREPQRMDGEVVIDRSSVLFMQVDDLRRPGRMRHG